MNEIFEVLTVRDLNFKDSEGRFVKGMQLWLMKPSDEKSWNGWEVLKVWISDGSHLEDIVLSLTRGDVVQVSWNRHGKPQDIRLSSDV